MNPSSRAIWRGSGNTKLRGIRDLLLPVAPLTFEVVDDVAGARDLVRSVRLLLHVANATITDELEVRMDGPDSVTPLATPMGVTLRN